MTRDSIRKNEEAVQYRNDILSCIVSMSYFYSCVTLELCLIMLAYT